LQNERNKLAELKAVRWSDEWRMQNDEWGIFWSCYILHSLF